MNRKLSGLKKRITVKERLQHFRCFDVPIQRELYVGLSHREKVKKETRTKLWDLRDQHCGVHPRNVVTIVLFLGDNQSVISKSTESLESLL